MAERSASNSAFGIRIAAFYGALFVVYGMYVPYMPVWLDWRGLSAGEISAVLAVPLFLRLLITPFVALAADRAGAHRALVIGLAWLSLGICLALSQAPSFWPIALLAAPFVICNSTIMPLTETIAVAGVRSAGLDYGRMRLWGSLTFVAASFAGGLAIAQYGGGVGIWLVAIGCVLTIIAAHALPRPAPTPLARSAALPLWRAPEPAALLRQPAFRAFLLAAGGAQAAHATFLGFGALIWQTQGLSGAWIGALWAIGVFVEVAVFSVSDWLIRRYGPAQLLLAAAIVSAFRWAAMALQPDLGWLIALQALHGVTYGASHIAAIHFVHIAVPRRAAGIGQALYATVAAGLLMGVATLIAGRLYAPDGALAYAAMVAVSGLAIAGALRLRKAWSGGLLLPEIDGAASARDDEPEVLAPEPRIGG
ncbi:MAG: MFS transporter [Hyphomicrobium sp.]